MRIAIAGVGGVGSNIAVNLVRSGVDFLQIIDMDCVEESNLNRQFYFADQIGKHKVVALAENLRRINPALVVEAVDIEITAKNCRELLTGCDLLVEGLDDAGSKKMLLEMMAPQVRLLVSASGIGGCDLAAITTRLLGNCAVVGDFASDCARTSLFSHKLQAVCARMTEILLMEMER